MGSVVARDYLVFIETILIIVEDFVCARGCTSKYLLWWQTRCHLFIFFPSAYKLSGMRM